VIDSIYVIHNHNWIDSEVWPPGESGQCVVGGMYGSGAVKQGYRLSNIFVETAISCAVGLQITKTAYNRHPTPEGCIGSILDTEINGIFFDEAFMSSTMNFDNYLSGEPSPESGCTGNLAGRIEGFTVSGLVAGSPLSVSDFIVEGTVSGFVATGATDPHPIPEYTLHANKNAYSGNGAEEIDASGVVVLSSEQCMARCHRDWSCDCVAFHRSTSMCSKRQNCVASQFDSDSSYDVYMRPWNLQPNLPSTVEAPSWASSPGEVLQTDDAAGQVPSSSIMRRASLLMLLRMLP